MVSAAPLPNLPQSWAFTDRGPYRSNNQDAYVARPEAGLWAVADGAGGHQNGEIASRMICGALEDIDAALPPAARQADVLARLVAVHDALRSEAAQRGGDLVASTVVVLLIAGGHFSCLWAGDSRAYLLRDGAVEQITRDHSLVQEMVDSGLLREEEAERHPQANVVTRAAGAETDSLELDRVTGPVQPGDRFLLCSDGVSRVIDPAEIGALLSDKNAASPAERLGRAAIAKGSRDNVTAIVVAGL